VFTRELQPTPKQAVRHAKISGREGESYSGKIVTGLPAYITWIAVTSKGSGWPIMFATAQGDRQRGEVEPSCSAVI